MSLAQRLLAALGALYCACAVALGAWAAHVADDASAARLATATLYLFLHGLALASLAPHCAGPLQRAAALGMAAGTLLFSGSLSASVLFGASTRLAPVGGSMLIVAWLAFALAWLRRGSTGADRDDR